MKKLTQGILASVIGSSVVAAGLLSASVTPAQAADAKLVVVTANTNFDAGKDGEDWNYLRGTNADVVLFQEVKNVNLHTLIGDEWRVIQDTSSSARQGSGIAVRKSSVRSVEPQPLTLGTQVTSSCTHDPVQTRWIASANIQLNNGANVRVASLHMPPKRCFGSSYDDMARHVVGFAKNVNRNLVIGADWNKSVNSDPNGIGASANLRPRGIDIDGFMTTKDRGMSVTAGPVLLDPIHSDHRPVRITLSVPAQ